MDNLELINQGMEGGTGFAFCACCLSFFFYFIWFQTPTLLAVLCRAFWSSWNPDTGKVVAINTLRVSKFKTLWGCCFLVFVTTVWFECSQYASAGSPAALYHHLNEK